MFLGEGVLKICSKFTKEDLCQSAISIELLKVNNKNTRTTSEGLLLNDDGNKTQNVCLTWPNFSKLHYYMR